MGVFNFISDIREGLKGYKTYIVAFLVAIFAGLEAYGVDVPPETVKLLGIAGIGAGVRAAIQELLEVIESSEDLPVDKED
mgnify:FL=1